VARAWGAALSRANRHAVRRLVKHGALPLVRRSNAGHTVEVRLPGNPGGSGSRSGATQASAAESRSGGREGRGNRLSGVQTDAGGDSRPRAGILFYCLRRVKEEAKTLDHVVPRVEGGSNSYRNLVSCCADCNSYKAEKPAADFLRGLYREGRLTAIELTERLRALAALAAGKLRPAVETLAGASADKEPAKQPSAGGDQPAKEFTPGPAEEHTEKA